MKLDVLINKGKIESLNFELNYFAQVDNIYIMDNHLAANWCWDKLPKGKQISILHIDAHYDFGEQPIGRFIYGDIDLTKIPIQELTAIKTKTDIQYFIWDNYFHLFNDKYPDRIKEIFSITQRLEGNHPPDGIDFEELDVWNLNYPIQHDDDTIKILNIDIDYFFKQNTFNKFELFSADLVDFFASWLLKHKANYDQITIALSPECCGSWDKAITMANRILKPLDICIRV